MARPDAEALRLSPELDRPRRAAALDREPALRGRRARPALRPSASAEVQLRAGACRGRARTCASSRARRSPRSSRAAAAKPAQCAPPAAACARSRCCWPATSTCQSSARAGATAGRAHHAGRHLHRLLASRSDRPRCDALIPSRSAVCDTNFVLDYFRADTRPPPALRRPRQLLAATPMNLADSMRRRMVGTFAQLEDVKIEHAWGGFVDISMNRAPDFGRLPASGASNGSAASNVYYLQGFSGHGLALTGLAGKLVAEAIAGDAEPLRHLCPPPPPPFSRRQAAAHAGAGARHGVLPPEGRAVRLPFPPRRAWHAACCHVG